MGNIELSSMLYFPQDLVYIQHKNEVIAFSQSKRAAINIDKNGERLLMSCQGKTTLFDLCQLQTSFEDISLERSIVQVYSFVQKLIDLGFISLQPLNVAFSDSSIFYRGSRTSKVLYIDATRDCNLRCKYCYNQSERADNENLGKMDLNDEEIGEIIRDASSLNFEYIVITGGEPLLRKNIFYFADIAHCCGMKINLLTNGTLIDKKMASRIAEKFDSVIVSLDSCFEEEHEQQRGKGTYKKIVEALKFLSKYNSLHISIRPVITKDNINNLYHFPKFAYENFGIINFEPTFYIPSCIAGKGDLNLLPDLNTYNVGMVKFYEELEIYWAIAGKPFKTITISGKCGAGSSIFSISSVGDVYPCQSLHYGDFKLGNIRDDSMKNIINESRDKYHMPNVFDVPTCKSCNLSLICGGGCRASAYGLYSNICAHNLLLCKYFETDAKNSLLKAYLNHHTKNDRASHPVTIKKPP